MGKRFPLEVLVIIYRRTPGQEVLILALRRSQELGSFWQPVTGGVEEDETIEQAALREAQQETGVSQPIRFLSLNYTHTFPVAKSYKLFYNKGIAVIKSYSFGLETDIEKIKLSNEHVDYQWMSPQEAIEHFKYRGNKEAVKRLIHQLKNETLANNP